MTDWETGKQAVTDWETGGHRLGGRVGDRLGGRLGDPTFVGDDARHFLLGWGEALDAVPLHQPVHLRQVLEGAVDSGGEFRNVVGLQDQLLPDGKRRGTRVRRLKCNSVSL